MQQASTEQLPLEDRCTVEEFRQFITWAGPVGYPKPTMFLAAQWCCGLLTVEEGRRIEREQQIARFLQQ